MSPRKSPSKAASVRHQLPLSKGVDPDDLMAKRFADMIGSSRMGETQNRDLKMGMGDVRREERKQSRIQAGKINRALERQRRAPKKAV